MQIYYYLSLIPESLIASMLAPEEFGNYYALGSHKRSRGQAIFFEIDAEKAGEGLDRAAAERRCVPHENGSPRKSSYLKIYRALESVPVAALKRLHLTTDDGRTLSLEPTQYAEETGRALHLYQELAPVNPRVVSKLSPLAFCRQITLPSAAVSVPRIVFAEMKLEALAENPDARDVDNLPYVNIEHLRDCLREMNHAYSKPTKTVIRQIKHEVLYRTIRGGFYVGDQTDFRHYALPGKDALETEYYAWWRSALSSFGA